MANPQINGVELSTAKEVASCYHTLAGHIQELRDDIHKLRVQVKCFRNSLDATPDDEMPPVLKRDPAFVVNDVGARTGQSWSDQEEDYIISRYNILANEALNQIGKEIGRTNNAVRCRFRQLDYYPEF